MDDTSNQYKMKNLLFLILSSILFNACTQTIEVIFDNKFQPSLEYTTEMVSTSKNKVNFTDPEEQINNIKSSGIKLPMIIEGSTSMTSTIKTFELEEDSTFKAKMTYDNVKSIQVQNGERTEKESPIAGMQIEGFYNSLNKFKIDTIISDKIDDATRQALTYTIENVQNQINFPDYPLKIGDSFEQEIPMNIPVAGISNVGIVIKTTYELANISGNIATFDFDQDIQLNMDIEQTTVSATGSGTGTSQFNLSKKFIMKHEADLTIELEMQVEELKVNAEISAISSQNVTIK